MTPKGRALKLEHECNILGQALNTLYLQTDSIFLNAGLTTGESTSASASASAIIPEDILHHLKEANRKVKKMHRHFTHPYPTTEYESFIDEILASTPATTAHPET